MGPRSAATVGRRGGNRGRWKGPALSSAPSPPLTATEWIPPDQPPPPRCAPRDRRGTGEGEKTGRTAPTEGHRVEGMDGRTERIHRAPEGRVSGAEGRGGEGGEGCAGVWLRIVGLLSASQESYLHSIPLCTRVGLPCPFPDLETCAERSIRTLVLPIPPYESGALPSLIATPSVHNFVFRAFCGVWALSCGPLVLEYETDGNLGKKD